MTFPSLPDISTCRQLANTIRRETGPLPESMRPLLAGLLLQFARILEEIPKLQRATETALEEAREAQATVNQPRSQQDKS